MNEFQTGAVRDTGGKGRMDLIPWSSIIRVSKHMEDAIKPDPTTGKPHYPERNWEKGLPIHCMIDSAFRHLAKYVEGWDDEDHLCAAATNLLMAMWIEDHKPTLQDIPSRRLSDASLLASDNEGGRSPVQDEESQGKGKKERPEGICDYYDATLGRCRGTKDMDYCNCNGNKSNCTYP